MSDAAEGTSADAGPYRAQAEPGALAIPTPPFRPELYQPRPKRVHMRVLVLAAIVGAVVGFATLGIGVLPLLVYSVIRRRQAARLMLETDAATRQLASGELTEPVAVFDRVAARTASRPVMHTLVALNRAVALLRAGRLAQARRLLVRLRDTGWLEVPALAGHAETTLAYCEALRGELFEAERWQEQARSLIDAANEGVLVFSDVVIAVREQRYEEAVEIAERGRAKAEPIAGGSAMRAMRLLEAFARVRGGASPSPKAIEVMVASIQPLRPHELDYLAVQWPELRRFMDEHGLLGASTSGALVEIASEAGPEAMNNGSRHRAARSHELVRGTRG